jgi:hypothetical protein
VQDPGLQFYAVALAFRLTPVTTLGLVTMVPLLLRRGRYRRLLLAMVGYASLFVLSLAAAAKKFDRYLLPCFPALDLLAAVGIVALVRETGAWRGWSERVRSVALVASIAVATLVQAAGTLAHHPYYLTYYNPLLGGGQRAVETITVGWGEGLDQAVRYLNEQPDADDLVVAAWGVAGVAPLLKGKVHVLSDRSSVLADYVVLNVGDVQFGSPHTFEFHGQVEPEHIVRLHGVEYAWAYRNDAYRPLLAAIEQAVGNQDTVVFGRPSQLSKHWTGEQAVLVLDRDEDEAANAHLLAAAELQGDTVWFVEFLEEEGEGSSVRRLLDTAGRRVTEHLLPPLVVGAYRIAPTARFEPLGLEPIVPVRYSGSLSLVGLGLSGNHVYPEQKLDVLLRWQARGDVPGDFTLFAHLLDRDQQRVTQYDMRLRDGAELPTSQWTQEATADARFLLSIPADTPAGEYTLAVGLYDAKTSDRLWLQDVEGLQNSTAYPLAMIHVDTWSRDE